MGYNKIRLPKGLVIEGEIKKEEELAVLIRELLDSSKPHRVSIPYVICSLPENKIFTRVIKIPLMEKKDLEEAIKWEAENHVPVSIDRVFLDWQILSQKDKEMEILLAAAPKDLVDGYVSTFKKAKLDLQALEPCAASKGRALFNEKEKDKVCLVIDIGATKTVFDLVSNNSIYFSSSIFKVSGNSFTKSIAQCLGIKEREAEKEKVACCSPKISEKERKILESIHPVLDELAREIEKIENYFYSRTENSKLKLEILLCGGAAGFFGIAPYLSLKMKKKVKLGNPWVNVPLIKEVPLGHADSLSFTEVVGLSLRGANPRLYLQK